MSSSPTVNSGADVAMASPALPIDAPWSVSALVLFRFSFIYLVLYSLLAISMSARRTFDDQLLFPALDRFWVTVSVWTATQVFGLTDFNPNYLGSDSVVSYVRVAVFIFLATAVTGAWSLADRHKTQYSNLHQWLRLVVCVALGLTLVRYGVQKILVVQMAPISLHQLIAPFGYFTPRQLLWAFMGASPGYQMFTGLIEVLAGAMLLLPRLATLGALLSIVAMTNVFLLNVFYDVDVKLFSLHLLGMAVFLLLPVMPRLALLLFNRESAPVERPKLFQWTRFARFASALPIVFAIAVIGWTVSSERSIDTRFGVAKPDEVPFYGIWDVEEFTVDGVAHPPLTTDTVRWHRVVFDDRGYVSIQRMSGSLIWAAAKMDLPRKAITFDHSGKPHPELREVFGMSWKAEFTFDRSSLEVLILTGLYDGRPATVKLRKSGTRHFLLPHERQWIRRTPAVLPYV